MSSASSLSGPDGADACHSAGCSAHSQKDYTAAIIFFRRALELRPNWSLAHHGLGRSLYYLGQVDEALDQLRQAAATGDPRLPLRAAAIIIPGSPSNDNQSIFDARRTWAEQYLPPRTGDKTSSPQTGPQARPLRIGYVSSFFQRHNWMKPVWGLINHHDRRRFQVHLYSDAPRSAIQYGYRPHAQDDFLDVTDLSNEALARKIEDDRIDLLVDLNGYSAPDRLDLFAMRPASVVVGWFNMYATTGIASYDYLIGDAVVIPPAEEKFYNEKIVRVPGSYLTFEVGYPVPPVVDPPCIANRRITFGSLAPQYKITREVIRTWSRIVQLVPNSSLILRNRELVRGTVRGFVRDLFSSYGISPERVCLQGPAEHYEFLETYSGIDIALDTFPYSGGATTAEAIWQGVPMVTTCGDRWASRTTASILHAATLGDLVAGGFDEYVSLAIDLANSPERLLNLRRSMRQCLLDSPACDTGTFARNIERLYDDMVDGQSL